MEQEQKLYTEEELTQILCGCMSGYSKGIEQGLIKGSLIGLAAGLAFAVIAEGTMLIVDKIKTKNRVKILSRLEKEVKDKT